MPQYSYKCKTSTPVPRRPKRQYRGGTAGSRASRCHVLSLRIHVVLMTYHSYELSHIRRGYRTKIKLGNLERCSKGLARMLHSSKVVRLYGKSPESARSMQKNPTLSAKQNIRKRDDPYLHARNCSRCQISRQPIVFEDGPPAPPGGGA